MSVKLGEFVRTCAQERLAGAMRTVNDLHFDPPGMGGLFFHFDIRSWIDCI